MTIFYLFNGNEYAEYSKSSEVDISALIHQEGTYMYNDWSNQWSLLLGTRSFDPRWKYVNVSDVPKEYRAKLLLLT